MLFIALDSFLNNCLLPTVIILQMIYNLKHIYWDDIEPDNGKEINTSKPIIRMINDLTAIGK